MGRFPDPPRPDHETPRTFLGEDTPKVPGTILAGFLFWQFSRRSTDQLHACLSLQRACRGEDMTAQAPNRPGYDAHARSSRTPAGKGRWAWSNLSRGRNHVEILCWSYFVKMGPFYRHGRPWSYGCHVQPTISLVLWAWCLEGHGQG